VRRLPIIDVRGEWSGVLWIDEVLEALPAHPVVWQVRDATPPPRSDRPLAPRGFPNKAPPPHGDRVW
jgi:hypothetical protein